MFGEFDHIPISIGGPMAMLPDVSQVKHWVVENEIDILLRSNSAVGQSVVATDLASQGMRRFIHIEFKLNLDT